MQKIVVALTSYPKRINIVEKVIESLCRQIMHADEIILYLCENEFPQKVKELPSELVRMIGRNGFKIEWVEENLKPHKKYFYALQNKRNDIVITVDDDVIYSETLISDLISSYKKFPMSVSARTARIMLRDSEDTVEYKEWDICPDYYANMPRMDLCAIGYAGILYPPLCAEKGWFDKDKIKKLAECQDDLWLKYNEIISKIPVVYAKPVQKDILIEEAELTALCIENMNGSGNDDSIKKLSIWMKENHIEKITNLLNELGSMKIYLYGAGKRARRILETLEHYGLLGRIRAIIVSDNRKNPKKLGTLEVKQLNEIDNSEEFGVIYGVGSNYKSEIEHILKDYNCVCLDLDIL